MKIAFLSSFFPYTSDVAKGNGCLYRAIEKSNEIKAFNFSLLYPELIFPGKEKLATVSEVVDIINSERILNTANPASYYFCANTINSFEPSLLISRYWMPYLGAAIGGTAKFINKNIKKIAIIDSMRAAEKQIFEEKTNELFVKNFDAFVVLSNQAKEDLLTVNPKAYFLEHPYPFFSANTEKIDKKIAQKILNVPNVKNVMLFLGPMREYRGIDVALSAISQLNSDFFLIIAGESPSGFDYYHRKISDLNIFDKVLLFERKINENEMPYFFAAADVLLMPFKEQSTREIINKTFSYELPVIASDVANFREIFEKNNFGLIIDNSESEQLIEAINKYYNENLEQIFKNNLSKIRYNSSWESLATTIYDIYDKLVEKDDINIY